MVLEHPVEWEVQRKHVVPHTEASAIWHTPDLGLCESEEAFVRSRQAPIIDELLKSFPSQDDLRNDFAKFVRQLWSSTEQHGTALNIIRVLKVAPDDLARILGSEFNVDEFLSGQHYLSDEESTRLSEADEAVSLLLRIFRPERLPEAIRRNADLFNGDTALDWILAGRIAEVAELYDRALTF